MSPALAMVFVVAVAQEAHADVGVSVEAGGGFRLIAIAGDGEAHRLTLDSYVASGPSPARRIFVRSATQRLEMGPPWDCVYGSDDRIAVCKDTPEAAASLTGYRAELGSGDDSFDFAREWNTYGLTGTINGGSGTDTITGSARAETIDGGLDADTLSGGSGDDTILARDGTMDDIDCGDGTDRATIDAADRTIGCETLDAPAADPAPPATTPPAPEPSVGSPAPPTSPLVDTPTIVGGVVGSGWTTFPRYTILSRLRVQELVPGTQIAVLCSGPSCPFKRKTAVAKRSSVNLLAPFKRRRLRPATTITVSLTRAGQTTKIVTLEIRRGKQPVRRVRCQPPGARQIQRC